MKLKTYISPSSVVAGTVRPMAIVCATNINPVVTQDNEPGLIDDTNQ